jgi:putative endonuclease
MVFSLNRKLGNRGEQLAEQEYLKKGFVLVARNIYNHRGKQLGEIDLIVRTEKELVFVEVKTRQSDRFGSEAESVTKTKQRKLLRIAKWFMKVFPQYSHLQPRIDVCVVEHSSISIIPSAINSD